MTNRRDNDGKSSLKDIVSILYVIRHKEELIFWWSVCLGLSEMGYNNAALCLFNSLNPFPKPITFKDDDDLVQKIKADRQFQKGFLQALNEGSNQFSIAFKENYDIFGALGHFTFKISQYEDGIYTITGRDRYDFDFEEDYGSDLMYKAAIFGNNLATVSNKLSIVGSGAIHSYYIYLEFHYNPYGG